ncbi:family 78 glycoside hydrolase catalytic domain [Bacteroidota bacterium]
MKSTFFFLWMLFPAIIMTFGSCTPKKAPPQSPHELKCEYFENPIGIDVVIPRLSWFVNDTLRGAEQSAYQIIVASSKDRIDAEDADIWNSGKIMSDQSHLVEYDGPVLKSGMRYYWRVKTWDQEDQGSSFSNAAFWETGFLDNSEWKGSWIGNNETGRPPHSIMLRKEFEVDAEIRNARVYVTGLGNYVMFINGKRVGKDMLTPGWTDYPQKVQYQTYDITEMLKTGNNAVGVMLGNMWWSSGLGWQGGTAYSDGPLRLLAQLKIKTNQGESQIVTDDSWKVKRSPIIENTIYHGVTWDGRLEQYGWNDPDFDDSNWDMAEIIQADEIKIVAQQGPTIQVTETRKAKSITEVKPGIYVFDFGVNMVGYERLTVKGPEGTRIEMRFAELLHEDGTVAQENLRSAKVIDDYICKGGGWDEIFEPYFTYHGFRYVQVSGLPEKPDENTLIGLVFHNAAEPIGKFECSTDILNRVQANIERGQRGNMHSVPTDCPQRDERLGWMGDAQMFAPTANYNMNMAKFFSKWERDIIDCQDEEGWVNDVNPAIVVKGPSKPAWGDAVVVVPWMVYKFYGDKRILEESYEGMKLWVEYMRGKSDGDIYIWREPGNDNWFGYGDWIAVEKSPGQPISAAYYYYSTKLLSQMAEVLGKDADFTEYADLAERIKKAFNERFFDPETNNYEAATQSANLLPLAFGLVPDELQDAVAKNVADNVIAKGKHPTTGFLGTGYILPMLSDYNYHELAYETAIQTTYPSWGYMVENGATSIWELWNSDSEPPEGMNSRNHFALGSVGEWYYAYLAGIRPEASNPGFKKSIIAPMPAGDLTWAKGSTKTPYGVLSSRWEIKDDVFILKAEIPANTVAEIRFPFSSQSEIFESGEAIYVEGGITTAGQSFNLIRLDEKEVVIGCGSGKYVFTVIQ